MRGRKLTDEEREISEQKRREYRNRKSRERYSFRKQHHLCVACAVPLTGDDPLMCPECRAKTRKTNSAVQQRKRDFFKEHGYYPDELPTFIHQDCFAYKRDAIDGCDALRELDCYNCAFYKRRSG